MEDGKRARKLYTSLLLALLISQSLVTLVKCRSLEKKELADQKNSYTSPPYIGGSKCGCGPSHGRSPPHGGYYNNPPPSPTTPSPPLIPIDPHTPPHGGSGCGCRPSHGGCTGASTPPSHGGYYNNPPPSPTVEPITPTTPSISTPPSPPFIPVDPNAPPSNPGGSPPFIPVDPGTPSTPGGIPGTSPYWSTHPTLIWGIFGYWATIGGLFGPATILPFGTNLSVQEALENTRADGFGSLYREGTASFLNSMVDKKFPLSTPEVRRALTSSLVSEKAAAEQARIFKLANEGRLKKH